MTISLRKVRLTRDVTVAECEWLPRDFREGELLWTFHLATYGAVGDGVALSVKPGEYPFYEFPASAFKVVP